jgi:hypothetical protein
MAASSSAKRTRLSLGAPECPICFAPYQAPPAHAGRRVPKSLGCGHAICFACASQLWDDGVIICPICKIRSRVPNLPDLPTCFALLVILEQLDLVSPTPVDWP